MRTIEHEFQNEDQLLTLRSQNIGSSEIDGGRIVRRAIFLALALPLIGTLPARSVQVVQMRRAG